MFSHLGIFLLAVLLPLIIYLTVGKDDREVRHHAREALNFQITFVMAWFVGIFVAVAGMFGSVALGPGDGPPIGFLLVFFGLFGLFVVAIGFSIFGAVQAGSGRRWRYPVSIRLVGRTESRVERTEPGDGHA